ncbi:MAG: cytidine deaminase [Chloroflexota bacterium]
MNADQALVAAARQARERAYAPYSGFAVGAALRTPAGRVIAGGNVENVSFGLTICAERAALVRAVAEGEREFEAIAVVSRGGAAPCGACRQVLAEFNPDLRIIVADLDGHSREFRLSELLPEAFLPAHL